MKYKINTLYFLPFIILFSSIVCFAQNADVKTIYDRLYAKRTNDKFNKDSVIAWQKRLKIDGTWPDIDYTIVATKPKSYSPIEHLERTYSMVVAYTKNVSSNTLYHDAALLTKIRLAIANNLGRQHDAIFGWNNDWYGTYIAYPSVYAKTLLMLKGEIPQNELLTYSAHLRDGLTVKNGAGKMQFAGKGQNLVWVATNSIYKGAIENKSTKIDSAFYFISSTLEIIAKQGEEGIKRDGAFHQHGAQLYSAGYGLWFTTDIVNSMDLCQGTSYSSNFNSTKKEIFNTLLLDGHQWFSYKSVMDYGAEGRNITRMGSYSGSAIATWLLDKMAVVDPVNASQYLAWKTHRNGGTSSLTGNKHFWQTDIMVQRGANFYLSTKVPSVRTEGTETMNTENLKGFYLAVGAMNILTSGNEYKDIFPTWDWSRVPGTTSELNVTYPSAHTFIGTNELAGGVSSGENGLMAFRANYNGIANTKAYFYLNGAVYCLGAGIKANKANAVVTSVNQTLTNGNIQLNNGSSSTFMTGTSSFNNLKWAHHDNVGYIFPNAANVNVKNDIQKGSWYDINNLYTSADRKAIQSKNVFSLWIDHGKTPNNATYQYIIAPDKNLATFQSFATNHGFVVAQNDTNIQAVRNTIQNTYAAAFYKAGKITFNDGLTLSVSGAALVLVEVKNGKYIVSVQDPEYKKKNLTVTLNKNLIGPNAIYSAGNTNISHTLPTGEYLGKTISNSYNLNGVVTGNEEAETLSNTLTNCFPNPFTETLHLHFDGNYSLFDLSGIEVERGTCEGSCEIGNTLISGMYILETKNTTKTERVKLLKK